MSGSREQELRSDELTGHLDLRAWHSDHGEAIIDLKTGQIGTAWLQVGGYIALYVVAGESGCRAIGAACCTFPAFGLTRKQKVRWNSVLGLALHLCVGIG